jgi:hypothetical protein
MLNSQLIRDLLTDAQRELTEINRKLALERDVPSSKKLLKEQGAVNKIISDLIKYKHLEEEEQKPKKLILG